MQFQILIVAPSWVGDTVMAQSLLKKIKERDNDIQIDVLAPEWSRPILERMPEVRHIIPMPVMHGSLALLSRYRLAKSLRPKKYSQAIILPNSWKSALIPFWAAIPKRTGWLGEMRWGLLNDVHYLQKKYFPKMIQRYVALASPKGLPALQTFPLPALSASKKKVAELCKRFSLNLSKPVLALCPGAAYGPAKRWPEKYFSEIANEYLKKGWQIWLFGSKQDKLVVETVQKQLQNECFNFSGKINLLETVDLLSTVSAVVANDSGLMHIAASLQRPTVAIYGSTSAKFTPPLGNTSSVVTKSLSCSPCFKRTCPLKHHRCMHDIKPPAILKILETVKA